MVRLAVIGTAYVTIRPDDAGFSQEAEKGILGKVGGIATKAAGVFAAGFAAKQGFDFFGGIVTRASDLSETISKVGVVFGDTTAQVTADAKSMADKFGIPKQTFLDAASSIGLIGKASGLAQDKVAPFSTDLARLATDASSFFNVPLEEALLAIRSGLTGEAEPLRRFGVLLNEAAVADEAVRLGLAKTGDELSDGIKVQARASLITKGLADANGDLERTQGSLSNRMRELKGRFENFTTTVGTAAIPIVLKLIDAGEALGKRLGPVFADVGAFIRNAFAPGRVDITWLDTLVGGIRALIGAFKNASDGITSSGFAGQMERIGIIARQVFEWVRDNIKPVLIGVAGAFLLAAGPAVAIGAALVLLYTRFQVVRDVIGAVVSFITGTVIPGFQALVSFITEQFGHLADFVRENWAGIQEAIGHVIVVVQAIIENFVGTIQSIWRAWGDEILNIVRIVWDQIRNIIDTVIGIISGIIRVGIALINGDWGKAWDAIKDILSTAWEFIKETVTNALRLVREVIEGAISGIVEFFGGVPGQIRDKLESLVGFLADIGERAVRAMADAIGGALHWVLDKAGDLVNKVKDKLTFWDSPPETFGLHVGQRLVLGLAKGLSETNPAKAAAERLVDAVKDQFSNIDPSELASFNASQERGGNPSGIDAAGFSRNSMGDPNRGRSGWVQDFDGRWVPEGGSKWPGGRPNGVTAANANQTMILSITGPLVNVEGSVIPGQEEELGRVAEQAVINMVRNGTVGREMSNRTMIISRR